MNHLKSGTAFFGQGSYKNNKYNGKELQETGMYSYGWREYIPDIGRWNGIDQLSENYFSTSPYAYVLSNPINMFDPDGRKNEAWLADAPEWLQEMWNATPDGTNSYWTNSGSSAGGGGGHFVYTGGTAGLGAGYGIGSTLDFAGNFNSQYGTVTNGVLNYTYWTSSGPAGYSSNGETHVQGIMWHSMKLDLNSSNSNGVGLFEGMAQEGFNWIQSHPREFTSIAGTFEGSSQIVAKGLKNWNAPSSITKSRIFAEVISTRLPASAQALGKFSTVLKWGGRAVGAIGIANSLYQGYNGNISTTRAAVDTVMGVVGFIGPWGAAASLVYFGGMAVYEHYYNDDKSAF
ncbi:RHS repeat-associated core domain-containing protein [Chryseobacterium sp. G0201]|uniref:RHS repeat-associated core domain-containing protein n=1 Tax=Chryseobacterium sp. G0201 TaxID=2487065 RepID=UPI000F4EE8DE|nr:RHS repeat-associated core domain-containing protein [Chryseobacterium sp. G0201]AZA51543.1 hypothetical protein EG348_00255 [Chryseobacterium sp. G0201]